MKNNFSTRIRGLRGDYSQSEFSQKIGVKQTTYSAWERGVSEPSYDILCHISNIFCVSIDYLLGLSDSRTGTCAPAPDPAVAEKLAEAEAEIARLNGVIDGMKMSFEALRR